METSELQLHDAQLLGVALDAVRRTAEVKLAYYPNEHASERILGMLRFSEVSHFNQLADLDLLEETFAESDLPFRLDVKDWHAIAIEFREQVEACREVIWSGE